MTPASSSPPDVLASFIPPTPTTMFIPPAEDPLLSLMTNVIMKDGKRHTAARNITNMLAYLHTITLCPPLPIVREAIRLASPSVKVVSLRKSAKNVPCPRPLNDRQRAKQAFKWILQSSKSRSDHSVSQRLAKEMVAIIKGGENEVLKKVETVHRLAVVNRCVLSSFTCVRTVLIRRLSARMHLVDSPSLCHDISYLPSERPSTVSRSRLFAPWPTSSVLTAGTEF